jgi:AraC-like DNA-binding protein
MKGGNHIPIPFYAEINDFLEATQVKHRATDPLFYCMRLEEVKKKISMPPFRRGFYFLGLLSTEKNTEVGYDNNKKIPIKDSFIVFQAPHLIYSFYRDPKTSGYLIYFKEDCFNFFKPYFLTEFPFFNILNTNLFQLSRIHFEALSPHFEELLQSVEIPKSNIKITLHKFLALLYQLMDFAPIQKSVLLSNRVKQDLVTQFVQLVNVHYIEKRTVGEYAGLLSLSENYLSRTVKSVTERNALSFITDRIVQEAKSLMQYTDLTVSEIGYHLNFSDASNFSKYFKKVTGISPTEYRKTRNDRNLPE